MGGIAQHGLHEERKQHGAAEQRKSQHEHQEIGGSECPVGEKVQVDDRIFLPPLPVDQKQQRAGCDHRQHHDKVRLEPVVALSFIQDNLQRAQTQGHQTQANVVDLGFRKLLALHLRRVVNETRGQCQRKNSDGNIQQKNPAPGEIVGNPAAESGTNRGRQHDRKAVHGEGHAAFGGCKSVRQNGLLAGLQTAASGALQDAEENQHAKIRRQSAEERTDGEDGDAAHVETLASDDG